MASKPPYMELAESLVGTAEVDGPENNPKILEFSRYVGYPLTVDGEGGAWCAAFAGYVLGKNGYLHPTGVAGVRAAEYDGRIANRVTTPEYGDLMLIGKPGAISHVTFFVKENAKTYSGLGGNQSNRVMVSNYKKESVYGFFRPIKKEDEVATPKPVTPAEPIPPVTKPARGGFIGFVIRVWRWLRGKR